MTSAAMVLGMLPTAISQGSGSEFRSPMAMGVIGGVISSTFLTLLVVPVFYLAVEGLKSRLARLLGRRPRPSDAAAVAAAAGSAASIGSGAGDAAAPAGGAPSAE
jgi:hypothetical protein